MEAAIIILDFDKASDSNESIIKKKKISEITFTTKESKLIIYVLIRAIQPVVPPYQRDHPLLY